MTIPGPGAAAPLVVALTGTRAVEVLERRQVRHGDALLTTIEARVFRQPGTHESRQPLQVPTELAAGIYEVRATVVGAEVSAEGSAIFQVVADH